MPVRKFRSVEEMNQPTWHQPGDPALYRSMALVWDFGRRTNPRRFSPGVERFASIDDMDRLQNQRDAAHVTTLRESRRTDR
jgi:hypothetical protein